MNWLPRLVLRLLPSAFREKFGADLAREWTRLRADARLGRGRVAEWRYLARESRAFVRLVRDLRCQDTSADRTPWGLGTDLTAAWRFATRRPISTLAVFVTLAIALASATVAHSVARAVLWRSLPYSDESRLVFAWENVSADGAPVAARVTGGRFVDWAERATGGTALAAFGATSFQVVHDNQITEAGGVRVASGFFQILGVRPALGRLFEPRDHDAGADPVLLLSYPFWQGHFGGRQDIVGQALRTTETTYTIIGVLPDIWLPAWPVNPARVTLDPDSRQLFSPMPPNTTLGRNSRSHVLGVVGRLGAGRTVAATEDELSTLDDGQMDRHRALLRPLRDEVTSPARSALLLLLGTALCVWLVACFNVAALQLAAFETRRAEFVTRSALGAGRWRLIRQLGAESAVIAGTAAMAAVGLARSVLQSLPAQLPVYVPFVTAPSFDLTSWLFVGSLAALAALVMVLWPVQRLRRLAGTASERSVAPGPKAFRGLVTVQLAGTVALVIISTLLLSSRWTLEARDLGFNTRGVSIADVSLPGDRYETPDSVVAFEEMLRERLIGGTRVRAAALAYDHPLEANWLDAVAVVGSAPGIDDVGTQAQLRIVSPDYFRTLGVRIVAGRGFEDFEGLGSAGVALVNEAFARESPVTPGRRLRQGSARRTWGDVSPDEFVIVGIVADERSRGPEQDVEPAVYLSTRQFPLTSASILAASASGDADLTADIRTAVRETEARASLSHVRRLDDVAADQQLVRTLTTNVVGGLALIALVLASVGLHGLLTLMVSGRQRDIGIRLALGASRRSVVNRVIGDSLRPVLLGVTAGLMLAQLAGNTIRSLLIEISVLDPAVLIGVSALMLAIGLLAAVVPARRASRVDPAHALRDTT